MKIYSSGYENKRALKKKKISYLKPCGIQRINLRSLIQHKSNKQPQYGNTTRFYARKTSFYAVDVPDVPRFGLTAAKSGHSSGTSPVIKKSFTSTYVC